MRQSLRGVMGVVGMLVLVWLVSAAPASATRYTAEKAPVQLTATQEGNHVLDAAGNTITCKKASFSGTMSSTSQNTINLGGSYSECSFFGVAVAVSMNGCKYQLFASFLDIVCEGEGTAITFKATVLGASCEVRIGEQLGVGIVSLFNLGSGTTREITLNFLAGGIKYNSTGSLCGKTGSQSDGSYTTGPTIIRGESDPGLSDIGIFVS